MSKNLMDTVTDWEITKYLLEEKHDGDISLIIRELDEMIEQTIRNAMNIAQKVSCEFLEKGRASHDQ